MKKDNLAILLVTHNRGELLDKVLEKISSFNWKYDQFVLINNASTDSTEEVIARYREKLGLNIIHSGENVGHGAGIALGLEYLLRGDHPDWIVFMEDDSIPEQNYLDFLIQKIEGSPYAMISSKGSIGSMGRRAQVKPLDEETIEVDFALLDGAIAKFDDLISVGLPVRDWFMMFDDFEYCFRIRKSGFQIGVCSNPNIQILHRGWGGGNNNSSKWRAYYQSRNFIHFVRLHFSVEVLFDFTRKAIDWWCILQKWIGINEISTDGNSSWNKRQEREVIEY